MSKSDRKKQGFSSLVFLLFNFTLLSGAESGEIFFSGEHSRVDNINFVLVEGYKNEKLDFLFFSPVLFSLGSRCKQRVKTTSIDISMISTLPLPSSPTMSMTIQKSPSTAYHITSSKLIALMSFIPIRRMWGLEWTSTTRILWWKYVSRESWWLNCRVLSKLIFILFFPLLLLLCKYDKNENGSADTTRIRQPKKENKIIRINQTHGIDDLNNADLNVSFELFFFRESWNSSSLLLLSWWYDYMHSIYTTSIRYHRKV